MTTNISNNDNVEELRKRVQELDEKNRKLKKAIDELSILNELALDIGSSADSEKIMRTIISRSIHSVGAEQGDVTLVDADEVDSAQTLVRSMVSSKGQSAVHLDQNLLGWMQINEKPLVINNPAQDDRFRNVHLEESFNSVLSVPMMVRSELIGILTLYNKKRGEEFTDQDKRLLSIIATQSAQVVENARLQEKEQALEKVKHELELAAKIQKRLLPKETPNIEGYGLCGKNITARSVGGDYYDFFPLEDNKWVICLGDVSGKGMPASLLMSNVQALLHGQIIHYSSPGQLLKNVNRQFFKNTEMEKFITFFLGILDAESNTFYYSSCGHEYPFLLHSDDSYIRLATGGIPLGVMENQEYPEETIEIQPGDKLVIFSDGIKDSTNKNGEMFGEERLEKLLLEQNSNTGEQLMENVFDASIEHNENTQPFDDMTMVVLSRNSKSEFCI